MVETSLKSIHNYIQSFYKVCKPRAAVIHVDQFPLPFYLQLNEPSTSYMHKLKRPATSNIQLHEWAGSLYLKILARPHKTNNGRISHVNVHGQLAHNQCGTLSPAIHF